MSCLSSDIIDYRPLGEVLRHHAYALALSPGFFQFYSLTGVLAALESESCLHATHISGSSAGALVGGFYASGWSPNEIIETLMSIKREDIWDMGGFGGLLQGKLFHDLLKKHLKVDRLEECVIPFGTTAYDILRFKTNCLYEGCLMTAIRASCTFPGLFQPVTINNSPHIDGGVFDDRGLMALPGIPENKLIVNIVCGEGREASSQLPSRYSDALLLTIVIRNIPMVTPFTMSTAGPAAYRLSKEATLRALKSSKVIPVGTNQWVCYIDGPTFHGTMRSHHPLPVQQQEGDISIPSEVIESHHNHSKSSRKRSLPEIPNRLCLGYNVKRYRPIKRFHRRYYSLHPLSEA